MANLFPTTGVPVTPGARLNRKVKFGTSWIFDFDEGEFRKTPSLKIEEADELTAYYEWCQKALLTMRYRHVIYSSDYGSELHKLFRSALSREAIESEIARMVTETLMVDPRTGSVGGFSFMWLEDNVAFDCQVVTAKGVQLDLSGSTEMAL